MKKRNYISTRNKDEKISASEAIVKGLSEDGGLYVPEFIEEIKFDLNELKDLSYPELTETILSEFLDDFSPEQISSSVDKAYNTGKFDIDTLVFTNNKNKNSFLELWHGPTAAFKDMALTMLPHLLREASKNTGEKSQIVILTATSGDTGKAALEGFKDVENTKIIVFYPKDGVSAVQEKQMLTTEGNNTYVVGVNGNFDDTQNGVKEIFNDKELAKELKKKGFVFSSANSINIGRLLPQIVYYYYSYLDLVRQGKINLEDKINFVVPSGNFGDILAGYYAKKTGLPVESLVCASNINHILTDFFKTGEYNIDREFYKTSSPSMDILISSNLERLIFEKLDNDDKKVKALMEELNKNKEFKTNPELFSEFQAGFADEEKVLKTIKKIFNETGILIDPHTAVGEAVKEDLLEKEELSQIPTIVLSTANPFKFSKNVYKALYGEPEEEINEFELQEILSQKTKEPIPEPLKGLEKKENRHDLLSDRDQMKETVRTILSGDKSGV